MSEQSGIIEWFARNRVAANLLMIGILVGGLLSAIHIKKEFFPELSTGEIYIVAEYSGAAPEEVEQGVCVKVEEAVQGIDGIKSIEATALEGHAQIVIKAKNGVHLRDLMDRIKSRIDMVSTFPEEMEKPVVTEQAIQGDVMWLVISGDLDEKSMKDLAYEIRDEMVALGDISRADIHGARDSEIIIEVSEVTLRQYGLTFDHVVEAVRRSSLDLPGGSVKSRSGDILIRTAGQAYRVTEFKNIPVLDKSDGARITLGDVARIRDDFEESEYFLRFDDKRALGIQIFRVGEQSTLDVARAVKAYVKHKRPNLPETVLITPVGDMSVLLSERLKLMLKNLASGSFLVFLTLFLFVRLRVAFWVMAGLPVCFLGALWLMPMPFVNASVNMITLYGFILVLGIVVDDAIVIGENIHATVKRDGPGIDSVIRGTKEVAVPVTAIVVILCLMFSLVESKLVLPAHLADLCVDNGKDENNGMIGRIQNGLATGLDGFIARVYRPILDAAIRSRYTTLAVFVALLIVTAGLFNFGIVRSVFFPDIEGDLIRANLTMAGGTPDAEILAATQQIEAAARAANMEIREEYDLSDDVIRHIVSFSQPQSIASFNVELSSNENRPVGANEIIKRWRKHTGTIPGAVSLHFSGNFENSGEAINFELSGNDFEQLQVAADDLKEKLGSYQGVFDIRDSFHLGKPEIKLSMKSNAGMLGITMIDLARQVRHGFLGAEAQTIQRGRDEVKVMVRRPESERRDLNDLKNMFIRTPGGEQVPFTAVASMEMGRGFTQIHRIDRNRVIEVTADVDKQSESPGKIIKDIQEKVLPDLMARYSGLRVRVAGEAREEKESTAELQQGAIFALFAIFVLMAIPLKSYFQPLVIMSAIPFGIVGAVTGHMLMGLPVSILSFCGMIALSGVVVNDSLVMVDFINKRRESGLSLSKAVAEAGVARFRAIFLTSMTTFLGLLPILLEKSLQAQYLIPMAASLAFGILFSTVITLVLVPSIYMVGADIRVVLSRMHVRLNGTASRISDGIPCQEKDGAC